MNNSGSKPSVEDLAKALKIARERGQQIVPIVGAGLSADCGFPIIAAVVRYFGKLDKYIQMRGPLYDYRVHNKSKHDIFDRHFSRYEQQPWGFFEDFGWPDRFRLNQDLFTKLKAENSTDRVRDSIDIAVREGLDRILPNLNPQAAEKYSGLRDDIDKILTELKPRHSSRKFRKATGDRFQTNWSKSAEFDVIGDWRRLILYFTNYRSDYSDALFATFGATRRPGQGHKFLAFLSKLLAVRTILTFNFDSLIEEALEVEGTRCKVFAMERGAGLPHQNLVRDQLSVIKVHGSTHALLLDEQLDRPLTREYLRRFDRITGANPILLVVGCSADDRRLRDMVLHVLEKSKYQPSVAWLHYETSPPPFLKENDGRLRRGTLALPTNNPGATLSHLYSWLTNSNPASRVPYLAHVQQPIVLAAASSGSNQSQKEKSGRTGKNQFDWIWGRPRRSLTASQLLLKLANDRARDGYQFIWIDLESLHTFAGVVGSIIDQCRKYDSDLAPSLLPVDIDRIDKHKSDDKFLESVIESAAKSVARALRRARYYLAIDGLDTYAWPATTHHGLTHMAVTRGAQHRVESMAKFLEKLEKQDLGESRVGVGLDKLATRYKRLKLPKSSWLESLVNKAAKRQSYDPKSNPHFAFAQSFAEFKADLPILSLVRVAPELKQILSKKQQRPLTDLRCRAIMSMVLFSLSCFRRTRPLVATTYLLEPLLGKASASDKLQQVLKLFTEQADDKQRIWILQQLEGGGYWFNHSIRDRIYAENTRFTDATSMRKCLGRKPGAKSTATHEHRRNTVFQLFLGAIIHQRISQIWYNHTFVQSRDTFAFLEYTYHRISSIRNLVKLRAFAKVGAHDDEIAKALVEGISKCGELIRLINEKNPPFEQLGFWNGYPPADAFRKSAQANSSRRNWRDEALKIEKSLQNRHHRQLHGLYRGWTRAELTLRTQVPAEQLLHWCDELLTDDLINRCNRLVIDYKDSPTESTKSENLASQLVFYNFGSAEDPYLIDPELERHDIKEFRRFLQDLQVKLWIERSDYETGARHRRRHLWHSLGTDVTSKLKETHTSLSQIQDQGPITDEIENCDDLIKECETRQCHQLLNIVNCKLKSQQQVTFDDKGLSNETGKIEILLKRIEGQLKFIEARDAQTCQEPPQSTDLNEAWLRLFHLQAEAQISHVSMFSHDGFTGDPQHWKPLAVNITAAQKTIAQGLADIGRRDVHAREAPRSVILHPTTDAALFLQYRSVFHLLRGRTEWLTTKNKAEGLKKALHSFEMARGGLDNDSPLISALIEIYLAEALLGRARGVLFNLNSRTGFDQAQEMHDSARGALRRARESLLASHRHLMWRKLFFRITTQYHSDRLLLRYARLQEEALKSKEPANEKSIHWEENAREALLRLRRAYQSLVSALDLYLLRPFKDSARDHAKDHSDHTDRFRWLYRMWWELTLCGYATGRVVIEQVRGTAIPENQADDYVIRQLKWINEADGVKDSVLGPVIIKKYRHLKDLYNKSLMRRKGQTALITALSRRREIIHKANELSKEKGWRKELQASERKTIS